MSEQEPESPVTDEVAQAGKPTMADRLVALLPLLALLLAAFGLASSFNGESKRADRAYADWKAQVTASASDLVAQMRYLEHTHGDLQPNVQWTGEGARILKTVSREGQQRWSSDPYTRWEVLAITPSGRYFEVALELRRDTSCEELRHCLRKSFNPQTEKQVKAWLYYHNDPQLFRVLFKEDMPPKEVKA